MKFSCTVLLGYKPSVAHRLSLRLAMLLQVVKDLNQCVQRRLAQSNNWHPGDDLTTPSRRPPHTACRREPRARANIRSTRRGTPGSGQSQSKVVQTLRRVSTDERVSSCCVFGAAEALAYLGDWGQARGRLVRSSTQGSLSRTIEPPATAKRYTADDGGIITEATVLTRYRGFNLVAVQVVVLLTGIPSAAQLTTRTSWVG